MTPEQDHLVLDNLKLIPYMVGKYYRKGIPRSHIDELSDEAQLALVAAASTYNPAKGPFAGWACLMMTRNIVRYMKRLKLYSVGKSMDDQSLKMPKLGKPGSEYFKRMKKKEYERKRIGAGKTLRRNASIIDVSAFRRGFLARSGILF